MFGLYFFLENIMATGYRKYDFTFTNHIDNYYDDLDVFAFILGISRGGYQRVYL